MLEKKKPKTLNYDLEKYLSLKLLIVEIARQLKNRVSWDLRIRNICLQTMSPLSQVQRHVHLMCRAGRHTSYLDCSIEGYLDSGFLKWLFNILFYINENVDVNNPISLPFLVLFQCNREKKPKPYFLSKTKMLAEIRMTIF